MKICAISDTHQLHRQLSAKIPDCDVLIHAGDLTSHGSKKVIMDFNEWIGELQEAGIIKYAVVVAGNHDFSLYTPPKPSKALLTNCIYLEDEGCEIDGVKFYGSPWTKRFFDWAFMKATPEELAERWSYIPTGVDVLITHGPPHGTLDFTSRDHEHAGCEELAKALVRVKPQVHVFGHIHEGYGQAEINVGGGFVKFINASSCTIDYQCTNAPIVFVLEPK